MYTGRKGGRVGKKEQYKNKRREKKGREGEGTRW